MDIDVNDCLPVMLAGGFGTRIQHLSNGVPKPMLAFHDRPFLEWLLSRLQSLGWNNCCISAGHKANIIEKYFNKNPVSKFSTIIINEKEPLGTGGGFLNVRHNISIKPFAWIVMNADSVVLAPLNVIVEDFLKSEYKVGLVGVNIDDVTRYGTLKVNEDELISFQEKGEKGLGVINAGIYLFKEEIIDQILKSKNFDYPISFEYHFWPYILNIKEKVKVYRGNWSFIDIGTVESYGNTEQFIKDHLFYLYL